MCIILGRPFLNTAGAVIDCTESKVTLKIDVEKLVTLGCVPKSFVPLGCIVYPRRLEVPRRLRVVKLRHDLGAPNCVVGVCPKNGVRAPDSALKDSDSGR